MDIVTFNGKDVDVASLVVFPATDYPDFADAYFEEGRYADGEPLTDDDLHDLKFQEGELLYNLTIKRWF